MCNFHDFSNILQLPGVIENDQWAELGNWWCESMAGAGKDLSGFDINAPLHERLAWCRNRNIPIACGYGRFSTRMQKSDKDQARSMVQTAGQKGYYLPPEYISIDRARSGRTNRRNGLTRNTAILERKLVTCMVFYNQSRVYRRKYDSEKYITEKVVGNKIRAVACKGGLDTDVEAWRLILPLQGIIDEQQIEATSTAVRNGHIGLFYQGFLLGSPPVGYSAEPIPGATPTKLGKPRMRQVIHPKSAALVRHHFELMADSIALAEGCRLWNAEIAAWPDEDRRHAVDRRSTTGRMQPTAYRRIFTRQDYRGRVTYGETRSVWKSEKDYGTQEKVKDDDIILQTREDLRIVDDALWFRVQKRFAEEARGQHGPRSGKETSLDSFLISMYRCGECGHVFHYYGQQYMHCPESTKGSCCNKGTVTRDDACGKIISALRDKVLANEELVAEIVRQSHELDATMDEGDLAERISALEKAVRRQNAIMLQIEQSCGDEGMDEDDKTRHKAAKSEKSRLQAELAALKARSSKKREPITESEVKAILADFDALLADAAAGKLGSDGNQRAAALIRNLVGGVVDVSFTRLQGRRAFGSGTFTPNPALAIGRQGHMDDSLILNLPSVTVEFRELPRYARIADEVHRLHVEEGLSLTEIGKVFNCGAGNAFGALKYWHESRGLAVPCQKKRHTQAAS